MAQTIKLKRSASSGAQPSTSDLALGELALNTYDGKVYMKKNDGSDAIVEVGAGSRGTTYVKTTVTASAGQTTVTGLTYTAGVVDIYLNGVKLIVGTDVTASNGTSIVLAAGAAAGDIIQIVAYAATGSMQTRIIKVDGGAANTTYTSVQTINGGAAGG